MAAEGKVPADSYTAEKNAVAGSSDVESSGTRSPAIIMDDDLPDPDVGKSDEERAKLVCLLCSSLCNVLAADPAIGQGTRMEDGPVADSMAVTSLSSLFPGPDQHW
jgi:hypothetical protein